MEEVNKAINDGREGKYLTFSLVGEEYGVGILKVKEIIGMMMITSVPQTPAYVKGVINLRGKKAAGKVVARRGYESPRITRPDQIIPLEADEFRGF